MTSKLILEIGVFLKRFAREPSRTPNIRKVLDQGVHDNLNMRSDDVFAE
jgi:hypothetical protein